MEHLDHLFALHLDILAVLRPDRLVHRPPVPGTAVQPGVPLRLLRVIGRWVRRGRHRRFAVRRRGRSGVDARPAGGVGHRVLRRRHRGVHDLRRAEVGRVDRLHAGDRPRGRRRPGPGPRPVGRRRPAEARRGPPRKIPGVFAGGSRAIPGDGRVHRVPDGGAVVLVYVAAHRPAGAGREGRVPRPDGRRRGRVLTHLDARVLHPTGGDRGRAAPRSAARRRRLPDAGAGTDPDRPSRPDPGGDGRGPDVEPVVGAELSFDPGND